MKRQNAEPVAWRFEWLAPTLSRNRLGQRCFECSVSSWLYHELLCGGRLAIAWQKPPVSCERVARVLYGTLTMPHSATTWRHDVPSAAFVYRRSRTVLCDRTSNRNHIAPQMRPACSSGRCHLRGRCTPVRSRKRRNARFGKVSSLFLRVASRVPFVSRGLPEILSFDFLSISSSLFSSSWEMPRSTRSRFRPWRGMGPR